MIKLFLNYALFSVALVLSPVLHGQHLAPLAGIDYQITRGTSIETSQFNLHAGVAYKEQLFLLAHVGYNAPVWEKNVPDNFHFYSYSFSGKVRILPDRFVVSPLVSLNVGFGHKYSGDTTYIGASYVVSSPTMPYTQGYFERIKSFGSLQLLADARWNHIHFQLGGGFCFSNMQFYRTTSPLQNTHQPIHTNGWIASASASYVLQLSGK